MLKRALFIFRRDLRLVDNTAFFHACSSAHEVIPCFIIDPRQFDDHPYRSTPALQFLIESLRELDQELRSKGGRLYLFRGEAEEVIEQVIKSSGASGVFFNKDYTPFSRKRDEAMTRRAESLGAPVQSFHDALLTNPDTLTKDDGKPYTVYTPYFKRALKTSVSPPLKTKISSLCTEDFSIAFPISWLDAYYQENQQNAIRGGRTTALTILNGLALFKNYTAERDIPSVQGTTLLSAHHKFGTVSIREVYSAARELFGAECTLIRELYWRDFFTQIAYHFPHVFNGAFHREYDAIEWSENSADFERWCNGTTGFPIVDAGMRQLNQTGYMHNRVRMIVASFLTKDLHISWQWGERYFARTLVDYDPAVNNGSWQWSASTGCDAQPYFRIFNPWLQQQRFDPECIYIKKWIPELQALAPKAIHKLADSQQQIVGGYPAPMLDHSEAKVRAERMFRDIK